MNYELGQSPFTFTGFFGLPAFGLACVVHQDASRLGENVVMHTFSCVPDSSRAKPDGDVEQAWREEFRLRTWTDRE